MYRTSLLFLICSALSFMSSAQPASKLSSDLFHQRRGGVQNTLKLLSQQKISRDVMTIAYLGGSITNTNGWRNKVDSLFRAKIPYGRFRLINAGIPSLGSLPHAFRLQRDVLDSGTIDLLFLEAAVNDHVNGTDSLTQVRTLEGIIRHARKSNPNMDIVMMSFADPDKTKDYDEGRIPVEVINHELIATHYNLPSINLAKEVHDRMRNGEFSWEKDFKDLHPSPFGQQLYFNSIQSLLTLDSLKPIFVLSRIEPHVLPAPLNPTAFERGKYVAIGKARKDDAWTIHPDWTPTDGLNTRRGFVHVPMLVTTTPGAALKLRFKGTAVGIAIVSGKDAGIIEYSIDYGPFRQIDLFTQWSKSLHLPWYVLFDGNLQRGKHTVQLRVSNDKNANSSGHAVRIVHFLVNE